jgi:hypothetical protein
MNAVAISNNDMVYLHWHVEDKIPGCLGFSVIRHEAGSQREQPLPVMVGFPSDIKQVKQAATDKFRDTNVWSTLPRGGGGIPHAATADE